MNKGVRKNHGNVGRRLAGIVLTLVMVLGMCAGLTPEGTGEVQASKTTGTSGHVADESTTTTYKASLGDNDSTRYAGRVWTDKSVSAADSVVFTSDDGSITHKVENDSDFLVTYSALATSQQIVNLPKIPVDVVFVLDFSASMCWGVDSTTVENTNSAEGSRIEALIDALNQTIYTLKEDNEKNRIGIVYFNRIGNTLLELTELSFDDSQYPKNEERIPQYLQITSFTGTKNQDNGIANISCHINGRQSRTDSKTNIQFGLNEGMSMLANENETTFEYEGENYTRIPNIVLMSDGAPTTISLPVDSVSGDGAGDSRGNPTNGSWWGELKVRVTESNGQSVNDSVGWGDNNYAWSANGFMPMITAEYFKNKITGNYTDNADRKNAQNTEQAAASMYTIGFSVSNQTTQMVELANLILNPTENWGKSRFSDVLQIRNIISAWEQYSNEDRDNKIILNYIVSSYDNAVPNPGDADEKYFRVEHPAGSDGEYDIVYGYPTYVDEYFSAENAEELGDAFKQITDAITESAKAPTEVVGNDPVHSGYITYTDPIGEYMEVKDVKGIIWSGEDFSSKSRENIFDSQNNVIGSKYVFSGYIDSPVYGTHRLSEITIEIINDQSTGRQTMTVKIPASAIPIRVNEVGIESDGTVSYNTNNGAYPIRVLYTVGLKDGIVNSDGTISDAVSEEYVNTHSDLSGNVYFYSNYYDGTNPGTEGNTAGNATVTFTPASDNPFYFVQQDTPLYLNEDLSQRANSYDSTATYYFRIQYYEGTSIKTAVIERSADLMGGYTESDDSGLYLRQGSPRLGYLNDFVGQKDSESSEGVAVTGNHTDTADTYYYPVYSGDNPDEDTFTVYLGNNGRLQAKSNNTSMSITKQVEVSQPGVTAPDAEFTFDLTISAMQGKSVAAVIATESSQETSTVNLSFAQETGVTTFTLKAGQTITIPDLPIGEEYTIEETDIPDGFTLKSEDGNTQQRTGTLSEAPESNVITYVNTYSRNGSITITKRDGSGNLLLGAKFTVYDQDGENIVCAEQQVYLAEVMKISNIDNDTNYNPVTNRYTVNGTEYIVHHTEAQGDFYYRRLTDAEIISYNSGKFTGEVEAVAEFAELKDGTYIVKETYTPQGYITVGDITVALPQIQGDTDKTYHYDLLYTVENHKNLVLPTTGLDGIGMIVAIGVLFIAGGGGYFMLRAIGNSGRKRHHG